MGSHLEGQSQLQTNHSRRVCPLAPSGTRSNVTSSVGENRSGTSQHSQWHPQECQGFLFRPAVVLQECLTSIVHKAPDGAASCCSISVLARHQWQTPFQWCSCLAQLQFGVTAVDSAHQRRKSSWAETAAAPAGRECESSEEPREPRSLVPLVGLPGSWNSNGSGLFSNTKWKPNMAIDAGVWGVNCSRGSRGNYDAISTPVNLESKFVVKKNNLFYKKCKLHQSKENKIYLGHDIVH